MELRDALYEAERELRDLRARTISLVQALYAAVSPEVARQTLRDHGLTDEEIDAAEVMVARAQDQP